MKHRYVVVGSLIALSGMGVITFNEEFFLPNKEARALLTKGKLLLEQGNEDTMKKAVEVFTTVAAHFPDTKQAKEALFMLAEGYENLGNIDVAIGKYRRLLSMEIDKDLADKVKFKIAKLQLSRYNTEEGFNSLMVLLSQNIDDLLRSDVYTELARFYSRQKNLTKSQANYEIALSENPKNAEANMEMAEVLFRQGKYEDALKQYIRFYNIYVNRSSANKLAVENFQDQVLRAAITLFQRGESTHAKNYFDFLAASFSETRYSEIANYYLGNIYYNQAGYTEAITLFDKVITELPDLKDESAYIKKAQAWYQLREYTKAAATIEKVFELYPDGRYKSVARRWASEIKQAMEEELALQNSIDYQSERSQEVDLEDDPFLNLSGEGFEEVPPAQNESSTLVY